MRGKHAQNQLTRESVYLTCILREKDVMRAGVSQVFFMTVDRHHSNFATRASGARKCFSSSIFGWRTKNHLAVRLRSFEKTR